MNERSSKFHQKEFTKRYEAMRRQVVSSYDDLIYRIDRVAAYCETQIEMYGTSGKEVPASLLQKFSDLVRVISGLLKDKSQYAM